MKRRDFVATAGMGAALAALATPAKARASTRAGAQQHHSVNGPLATAFVSFGAWAFGINRRPNVGAAAGLPNNVHALIPDEVTIKAGGTVNYIIALEGIFPPHWPSEGQ